MITKHPQITKLPKIAKHLRPCLLLLVGCAIQAFGLYHIHSFSGVTEGGVLGLTLLLDHHFGISPSVTSFVMNALCYLLGWRVLGGTFIGYSVVSGIGFSVFYALIEQMEPLFPSLSDHPLIAALAGALFIGVGAGICVRVGGAPGGDDALAMSLSKVFSVGIRWVYLASDFVVLGLSITYLPPRKLVFSLLSVILSGQIIGLIEKLSLKNPSVQIIGLIKKLPLKKQ
ncbi:MAG: YitT family protein [Clostridia bacterium]|nr:YitT family protein [Clostridia bacterium]